VFVCGKFLHRFPFGTVLVSGVAVSLILVLSLSLVMF
jgi:hypothetical protein